MNIKLSKNEIIVNDAITEIETEDKQKEPVTQFEINSENNNELKKQKRKSKK